MSFSYSADPWNRTPQRGATQTIGNSQCGGIDQNLLSCSFFIHQHERPLHFLAISIVSVRWASTTHSTTMDSLRGIRLIQNGRNSSRSVTQSPPYYSSRPVWFILTISRRFRSLHAFCNEECLLFSPTFWYQTDSKASGTDGAKCYKTIRRAQRTWYTLYFLALVN